MCATRPFSDAANGLPQVPMEAELWAAGCDLETARLVAKQLDREGYRLIKPLDLWSEHKHFEGERKYALRQIVKWMIAQAETDKCSAFGSPSRPRENRPPGRFSGSVLD